MAEEVASRDSSKGKENHKEKPFKEGGAADVLLIREGVLIYVCILKQEIEHITVNANILKYSMFHVI